MKQNHRKLYPKERGFTLVELLVVIAIITLLFSVAFVNIRDAQSQARDANVRENLLAVIKIAEFSLSKSVNDYDVVCNDSDNTLSDGGDFGRLEYSIETNNGRRTVNCFESPDKKSYAISSPLLYLPGHWCIDSSSISKFISDPISTSQCP